MLTQAIVNRTLQEIEPGLLLSKFKKGWSFDNPTHGYCYLISEMIYHFIPATEVKAYCISFLGGTHWYVVADGKKLDFTAEQFLHNNIYIPYENSVARGFFKGSVKTNRGYISKRGASLSKYFNLNEIATKSKENVGRTSIETAYS